MTLTIKSNDHLLTAFILGCRVRAMANRPRSTRWINRLLAEYTATEIAQELGVSRQNVYNWRDAVYWPDWKLAKVIAATYGIPREQIRPDIWD